MKLTFFLQWQQCLQKKLRIPGQPKECGFLGQRQLFYKRGPILVSIINFTAAVAIGWDKSFSSSARERHTVVLCWEALIYLKLYSYSWSSDLFTSTLTLTSFALWNSLRPGLAAATQKWPAFPSSQWVWNKPFLLLDILLGYTVHFEELHWLTTKGSRNALLRSKAPEALYVST